MATKTLGAYKKLAVHYQDIEREVIDANEVKMETIDADLQKRIVKQVNDEYELSYRYNEAKRALWLARLKLYNNQKRDDEAVGDPLLFTVFNTIHAALYDDRLMATFEGRGGDGDEDVEENLNALANFDYDVMGKNKIDYDWNWDAEFFGRGLLLMMDFNRSSRVMAPCPEVLDPTTFIRDPNAKSVNGDSRGRGAMRFGGWEVGATYYDLKNSPGYFNISSLRKDKSIQSLLDDSRQARRDAQGNTGFAPAEEMLGKYDNYEFKLLNWFTHIKGEKYLVTLGNCRSVIIRMLKIDYDNKIPIIDRAIYPMSHDWDGVSIPDLCEDKQRARSILINLGLKSAKSDAMPQYLYDKTRIKNKNDLNWKHDKFIGVDGRVDGSVQQLMKGQIHQQVQMIMEILDAASQRATATPEIQQGMPQQDQRTLGELNLVASKVDTRYSMSAKVYGWSEKDFWNQWYLLYKKHFKSEIDEKVVRIQGALAPIWRPLTKENIIASVDPDVRIESRVISEGKRQREQQSFMAFAQMAMQNPENNRRAMEKKTARLFGATKEEIDLFFGKTVDEMQAEDENEMLNNGKLPPINVMDDHQVHINIHAKANQTPEVIAHVRQHKKLMLVKRNNPELIPQPPQPQRPDPQGQPQASGPQPPATPAPTTPTQ